MSYMQAIGKRAREAAGRVAFLGQEQKALALESVAGELSKETAAIIRANQEDVDTARAGGMKEALVDRLRLDEDRIAAMAAGLREIKELHDPVGEYLNVTVRPNGLKIGRKRVPLGVVGIIYESRPNVTADAFGLCFKTGNAAILRGSKDSLHSNMAIIKAIKTGLMKAKVDQDAVILVEDTSHAVADEMMNLKGYIDVLIPRGGAGLIARVTENSCVPVIETGTGNCHVYVDEYAQVEMAVRIIENAKTQRLGVCNACESLVVHQAVAARAIPLICKNLQGHGIEIRGDELVRQLYPAALPATESDWGTEYLDKIISIKTVDDIEAAIAHINKYNTGHSETIVTDNLQHAELFQERIDASCVYINASTRFTDGFEFGFGAEIGISTQKLHARGPMGLEALTTTKYVIFGNGQIRK